MKKLFLLLSAIIVSMGMWADDMRVYCQMNKSWWTTADAAVGCHSWGTGTGTKWPGVRMNKVNGEPGLWYIDLDTTQVQQVIFTRVNPTGDIADWGAKTQNLNIPTDGKNLFTITTASAIWGDPGCTGEWSTYVTHEYTYDTAMFVAGNFTKWADEMIKLPTQVNFPKDSTIQFKQVQRIITFTDAVPTDTTLNWGGQATENFYMTRENIGKGWTLDGKHNVLLTTDVEGDYGFSMDSVGHFVVTFPEKPVQYFAKNNWNGGDWDWLEMTAAKDDLYVLDSVVFGGTGININTKTDDADAIWFPVDSILVAGADTLLANDTVIVIYDAENNKLRTNFIGRPHVANITYDTTYYVAGSFTDWQQKMEILPDTVYFPADSTIEFQQVRVIITYTDSIETKRDTAWFGQENEGGYMTRTSNAWTLNGKKNVLLTTDAEGLYIFNLVGETFTVTFPEKASQYGLLVNGEFVAAQINTAHEGNTEYMVQDIDLEVNDTVMIYDNSTKAAWIITNYMPDSYQLSVQNGKYWIDVKDTYSFYFQLNGSADTDLLYVQKGKTGTAFDQLNEQSIVTKVIRGGHLYIIMDGKTYNVQGLQVK